MQVKSVKIEPMSLYGMSPGDKPQLMTAIIEIEGKEHKVQTIVDGALLDGNKLIRMRAAIASYIDDQLLSAAFREVRLAK